MIGKKTVLGIFFLVLAYSVNKYTRTKPEGKVVKTNSGSLKGVISVSRDGREFYEWLGIPYAKAPVGELRFESPQPMDKWEGVRDAVEYGGRCAQLDMLVQVYLGVEDCLFLNIHTPKKSLDKKKLLPVMFYIHGGYFAAGSSNSYRPDYFMDENVVLVTINYRLGALGFLSTGDSAARGNMGLKDQSLALKWVNENIAKFGGDPKQITIFGESAGGASVHYHMMSPMSKGLFQRAITQSGTALNLWALHENPVREGKNFARNLNCPTESSLEMVACLRKADISDLLSVHKEILDPQHSKEIIFVPVVETIIDEETFLTDHPENLMNSGQVANIPWLTGMNANEGLISTQFIYKNTTFREIVENDWNALADAVLYLTPDEKKHNDKIKEFYFGAGEGPLDLTKQFMAVTNLVTDRFFTTAVYKAALSHSTNSSVQLYYYNHVQPSYFFNLLVMIQGKYSPLVEVILGKTSNWFNSQFLTDNRFVGVCHADELPMLFEMPRLFSIGKDDANYKFSKDMVNLWVSFASDANTENAKFRNVPAPKVTGKEILKLKFLEIKEEPTVNELPLQERLTFWANLGK